MRICAFAPNIVGYGVFKIFGIGRNAEKFCGLQEGGLNIMNLIVAVDNNWAIGCRGELLVRIPNDHKNFRHKTMGGVVVLGRKTLETFPQKAPLGGRTNIILSTDAGYKVKDATVAHSEEELLEELKKYNDDEVYIIGGTSVYNMMLPYCSKAYVTKIDHEYEADAYFPNLDLMEEWELIDEGEEQTYFDIAYQFLIYERKNKYEGEEQAHE